MWEPVTLRAEPVSPGDSKGGMSGKKKKGSEKATPSVYGRLTRHERDTVQKMLELDARASRAMLGGDAETLLDAYSLEDVPIGRLDLTPSLIERARAERRDAPLA